MLQSEPSESTPKLSETQSVSVDGTEVVTQNYMVSDQLERERVRIENKKLALQKSIDEYGMRKEWLVHHICHSIRTCDFFFEC